MYDKNKARELVLTYCSSYVPRTAAGVARELKARLPGFYPKTLPQRLRRQIASLAEPLLAAGLLVAYTPTSAAWPRAREMATKGAKAAGEAPPRNTSELYQANFLYSPGNTPLPVVALPLPSAELNFEMRALLHRFAKPENYTWEMLNLLMAASVPRQRDDLRLHLYVLPLDHSEVELLERVLEFGGDFIGIRMPLRPSVDEAKGFLEALAGAKME